MLLLNELSRLEGRSTKELSIDELSMLRVELESSKAIKELEGRRRQVCESAHRAVKRWLDFDIRGLRRTTRKVRIKCRFLFLQLLSTLFKGFKLIDGS